LVLVERQYLRQMEEAEIRQNLIRLFLLAVAEAHEVNKVQMLMDSMADQAEEEQGLE
jgi:hypothetical protein